MKKRVENLLTIKSIVTLCMTAVFCILALKGVIDAGQFITLFTMIIGFYFGTQAEKRKGGDEGAVANGGVQK